MTKSIFTGAALTGLLLASGCGGGTGSTGAGITPATGGGTVPGPTSRARGSASVHFLVPIPRGAAGSTASSSRRPSYVSPGSSGIQVLIGDGNVYNATNFPTGQQYIIGSALTPAAIPSSATSGTFTLPSTIYGYALGAVANYSYALSSTAGYYNFSLTITGLVASTTEHIGVVLTDIGNNNFVLSEGSNAAVITAATGLPATAYTVTLKPVLDKAYLVGPGPAILVGGSTAPTGDAFQFTAYAADERGYPIPTQAGVAFDSSGSFSIAQYQGAGVSSTTLSTGFGFYNTGATLTTQPALASNTSLNPPVYVGNGQLTAAVDTLTTAVVPGATSAGITITGASNPLIAGTQLVIGGTTVTVTAASAIAGGGPYTQSITFTPALTAYSSALASVTLVASDSLPTGGAGGSTVWTVPGNAISNLAFAQVGGTPTIAGTTGYIAGQPAVVTAAAPGTYGVVAVGNFSGVGTVTGYTYNYGVNYPAAATNLAISSPASFTVPGGLGITVSGAKRQQ